MISLRCGIITDYLRTDGVLLSMLLTYLVRVSCGQRMVTGVDFGIPFAIMDKL